MTPDLDHTLPLRSSLKRRLLALDRRVCKEAEASLERLLLDLKRVERTIPPIIDYLEQLEQNALPADSEEENEDGGEEEGGAEASGGEAEGEKGSGEGKEEKKPNPVVEKAKDFYDRSKKAYAAFKGVLSLFVTRHAYSLQVLTEAMSDDSNSPFTKRVSDARASFFGEELTPDDIQASVHVIRKSRKRYQLLEAEIGKALHRDTVTIPLALGLHRSDSFLDFYRELEKLAEDREPLIIRGWEEDGISKTVSELGGIRACVEESLAGLWKKSADSHLRRLGRRHGALHRKAAREARHLAALSEQRASRIRELSDSVLKKIHGRLDD